MDGMEESGMTLTYINKELRRHAPFTLAGAVTGMAIMAGSVLLDPSTHVKEGLFWTFHPLHVFLSAMVTASMYRYHGSRKIGPTVVVGYVGSIGIATLSDCVMPFIGETLLELPNRGLHLGVIEKWWLVNPMAFAGIGLSLYRPSTCFPHTGHVLLSTWASLFHTQMALSDPPGMLTIAAVGLFLFLAVWIPCCTSDIVFPLLAAGSMRACGEDQKSRSRVAPIHPCHGTKQITGKESFP